MKFKDPYGKEYVTLEHIKEKKDVEEWITDAVNHLNSSFYSKSWSEDKKEGYRIALKHLHHAMQTKEWI